MGILDWFRRRPKEVDEEKEVLERTSKLQTEVEARVEPTKRRKKKGST